MSKRTVEHAINEFLDCFQQEVVSGKTRRVRLLGRKCSPELMRTFLGYELKLGRKRVTCPDMTTARYLKIFAELGVAGIEIPYDPTRTARILPRLESSFQEIKELLTAEETLHSRSARETFRRIRDRLQASAPDST